MKCKMLHTCIRVMDLEESLKFYTEALGLVETGRKDFPESEFTIVYLGDEDGNYEIELTYNYNPEEPYTIGDGFGHLAFSAENLEEAREKHKKMGYKVTELMGLPGEDPKYYFVTDPDGFEVEIIRAE